MLSTVSRTIFGTSTYVVVEISPETTTRPVLTSVSQATRPVGSSRMTASSTPSEIWSAILSGWPSVTDSEVKRKSPAEASCGVVIGGRVATDISPVCSGGCTAPRLVAAVVLDHERDALEAVALAQPVLEEEPVIAGQAASIRHLDREAGRPGRVLGHVEQLEAAPVDRGRLAGRLQIGQEAVELGGRDPSRGAVRQIQ